MSRRWVMQTSHSWYQKLFWYEAADARSLGEPFAGILPLKETVFRGVGEASSCFPPKTSRRRAESRGNTRETNKLTIRLQIGFSSLIRVVFFFRFFFGASSFELNHPVSRALLWESEPPSHSEKRCRLVSFTKFNYMRAICDFFFLT